MKNQAATNLIIIWDDKLVKGRKLVLQAEYVSYLNATRILLYVEDTELDNGKRLIECNPLTLLARLGNAMKLIDKEGTIV